MTSFCECQADGFCPRYQREMGGRLRELCAGINVDLGTAAAFREQWLREAKSGTMFHSAAVSTAEIPQLTTGSTSEIPQLKPQSGTPLLLKTDQAPGDAVAMTAAIYSLRRAHPGRYATAVESYWPEVFQHNPDVPLHLFPSDVPGPAGMAVVQMHYPAIHASNDRAIHFMQGWCEHLSASLGVPVPLLTNRPRLYFADELTVQVGQSTEDFWLICSGGKRDFTNKLWGTHNYQAVVDALRGQVQFVQVGGARPVVPWNESCRGSQEDEHPRLAGTHDMVGKTTLRELFDLTRRASGVLCGVSLLMHVAAAVQRPAIVIAGGREPVAWNAYPLQQYVHAVGALPCRDNQGYAGGACWRARVQPMGDGTNLDRDLCERPVDGTPTSLTRHIIPECMNLIRPSEVVALISRYNAANQRE